MRMFNPTHIHPVDETPGYINKSVCIIFVSATSCGVNSSVVSSHIYVTRYKKIDHLQELLNSRYRLTKSGYGK